MRIDSLPTWPLGIPRFTSAGKRFNLSLDIIPQQRKNAWGIFPIHDFDVTTKILQCLNKLFFFAGS
jgi:hypothetical protein